MNIETIYADARNTPAEIAAVAEQRYGMPLHEDFEDGFEPGNQVEIMAAYRHLTKDGDRSWIVGGNDLRALCDVMNATGVSVPILAHGFVFMGAIEELAEGDEDYSAKWGIDVDALAAKLKSLSVIEKVFLFDFVVRRFWSCPDYATALYAEHAGE